MMEKVPFFSFLFRPRGFGEFDANVPSNLVEIWLHKLCSTLGILPLLDSLDPYHASIEKPDCLAIPSAMGQNLFWCSTKGSLISESFFTLHGTFLEWWNTTKSLSTVWQLTWWGDYKNMQEIEISRWLFQLPARYDSQSSQSGSNFLPFLDLP